MSYFTTIDGEPSNDIATNTGWRDFSTLVSTLTGIDELRHLTEYGWVDDLSQLKEDIDSSLEFMDVDQKDIAGGLLEAIQGGGEVLVISDGFGDEPGDGEDKEEE